MAAALKRSPLRADPEKVRAWVERSRSALTRSAVFSAGAGSGRRTLRARVGAGGTAREASPRELFQDPCALCRACGIRPGVHVHHVVYAQKVRREGGDLWAAENALSCCFDCHSAHHLGAARIPLAKLRDENVAFAFSLLGPAADAYLRRRYSGDDPRVEAALAFVLSAGSVG